MNRLVRLYPAAWRERYGEELSAVLQDRPPSPFDVADLLLAAVDAHLHLRGLGNRSEHRKGIPMSLSIGGIAAVVSGGLWASFYVWASTVYYREADNGTLWIPVLAVALLSLVAALAGLSGQAFRASPSARWVAVAFPASGVAFALVGMAIGLVTGNLTYDAGEIGTALLYVGLLLMMLGSIGFALISATLGTMARVASVAIVVGAVPTLIAFFGGIAAGWLAIGGVMYGLGWVGLGIDAIRRDRSAVPTGHASP